MSGSTTPIRKVVTPESHVEEHGKGASTSPAVESVRELAVQLIQKDLAEKVPPPPTTPPTTPTKRHFDPPIPPTPSIRKSKTRSESKAEQAERPPSPPSLFSNPLEGSSDVKFEAAVRPDYVDLKTVYSLQGKTHNVIKQSGSKSCVATALLMLYTDVIRQTGLPFDLGNEFWDWYATCSLAKVKDLGASFAKTNLLEHGWELNVETFHTEKIEDFTVVTDNREMIDRIRTHIRQSGFPVIVSIIHPIIQSHAIVVDEITNSGETTLRDPYSGIAYQIPFKEFQESFGDSIAYDCLFLSLK